MVVPADPPRETPLNWRAFVEPESGAVLYLRALAASATCAVFETDPIAKTGVQMTAASAPATLDAVRTLGLTLQNLDPPGGGVQALGGTRNRVQDITAPPTTPPFTTTPFQFEYSAVTDKVRRHQCLLPHRLDVPAGGGYGIQRRLLL